MIPTFSTEPWYRTPACVRSRRTRRRPGGARLSSLSPERCDLPVLCPPCPSEGFDSMPSNPVTSSPLPSVRAHFSLLLAGPRGAGARPPAQPSGLHRRVRKCRTRPSSPRWCVTTRNSPCRRSRSPGSPSGLRKIRPDQCAPRLADGLTSWRRRFADRIFGLTEEAALACGEIIGGAVRQGHPMSAPDGVIAYCGPNSTRRRLKTAGPMKPRAASKRLAASIELSPASKSATR